MKIIRKRRWIILWVIVGLILFVGLPMAIAKAKCYEPNSLVFNHKGNLSLVSLAREFSRIIFTPSAMAGCSGVGGSGGTTPPPETLYNSTTISGVKCKTQAMCNEIDTGITQTKDGNGNYISLKACINNALSGLTGVTTPVVVTDIDTAGVHTLGSYHYQGKAVDIRINDKTSSQQKSMQQSLYNRSGKLEVFGPYTEYCYNDGVEGDCGGEGTTHIHFACS